MNRVGVFLGRSIRFRLLILGLISLFSSGCFLDARLYQAALSESPSEIPTTPDNHEEPAEPELKLDAVGYTSPSYSGSSQMAILFTGTGYDQYCIQHFTNDVSTCTWVTGTVPTSIPSPANYKIGLTTYAWLRNSTKNLTTTAVQSISKFAPTWPLGPDFYFNLEGPIHVDSNGNIYVSGLANSSNVNASIFKFNSSWVYQFEISAEASGLLVDNNGFLWITDGFNNKIVKYSSTGQKIQEYGGPGTGNLQFNRPGALAKDSFGNLYVVDAGNQRIQKFDTNGTYISQFGSFGTGNSQFNFDIEPRGGIGLDSNNNIYIYDPGNDSVKKFNASFGYLNKVAFGSGGNPANGVSVDSADNVYVYGGFNKTLKKYDPNLNVLLNFNVDPNGWSWPYSAYVAIDQAGNMLLTDLNSNQVKIYDSSGNHIGIKGAGGSGSTEVSSPTGLALDSTGNLWVLDAGTNRVKKIDSSGNLLMSFGSYGSSDGQFKWSDSFRQFRISGIGIDSSGNVYVADHNNCRIQKFNSSGVFITKTTTGCGVFGAGKFMTSGAAGNRGSLAVNPTTGDVYYGDNMGKVMRFNSSLVYQNENTSFSWPPTIAIDSAGNLYAVQPQGTSYKKLDSNLNVIGTYGSGANIASYPDVITVDLSGNVYVRGYNNPSLVCSKFDSAGVYQGQSNICKGQSFVWSPNGTVYVSNESGQIYKLNSSEQILFQ